MRNMNKRIRILGRFIGGVAHIAPKMFAWVVIVLLLSCVLSVAGSYLLSMLVGSLQVGRSYEMQTVVTLVLLVVIVRIGSQCVQKTYGYLSSMSSEAISFEMQKRIVEKLHRLRFETFENTKTLDLISRLSDTLTKKGNDILQVISNASYTSIVILAYCLILAYICWYYPLILIVTSLLSVWISTRQGMDRYILTVTQSRWWRMSRYIEKLVFDKNNMKELRVFALMDHLISRWHEICRKAYREEFVQLWRHTIMEFLGKLVQFSGPCCCLFLYGRSVICGEGNLQNFYYVLTVSSMFFDDLQSVLQDVKQISHLYLFMDDMEAFEALETSNRPAETDVRLDQPIRFEHVSFRYPGAENDAICDLNFEIQPGETVVCVGENGAGKTTFVGLMLGLLTPTSGRILCGKHDMRQIIDSVQRRTGYVPQRFTKYQMKASEALGLGCEITIEMINRFPILSYLRHLPEGLESNLGQMEEGGVDLSGGEWQRLAVGRALLKQDADILVMDEFTAALDPLAESELYQALHEYMAGRTVVITSHRLSVCNLADRILVFSGGKIIEEGSHKQLMQLQGEYYKMYQAQSSIYNNN